MRKPSAAMMKALEFVQAGRGIRFQTGEALRRRGLLDRYTDFIRKSVYVTHNSVTVQPGRPMETHEWYLTGDGRNLLNPF